MFRTISYHACDVGWSVDVCGEALHHQKKNLEPAAANTWTNSMNRHPWKNSDVSFFEMDKSCPVAKLALSEKKVLTLWTKYLRSTWFLL